jgi:hypothetical protein
MFEIIEKVSSISRRVVAEEDGGGVGWEAVGGWW